MERVKYIDTTKGYLMLLVIIGHVLIVLNPNYDTIYFTVPQAFIYTFHMPAFFILHGIIFDMNKWRCQSLKVFVLRRLQTLIVPYCFFEVIGIICRKLVFNQPFRIGFYNLVTLRCNIGADWFLPAMFLGGLLFWTYVKYPNWIYAMLSTGVCFLLPMVMGNNQLLVVIGRGMLAYAFIMCGYMFKKLFLSEKIRRAGWFISSLIVTTLMAVIGLKYGSNDFYSCTVQNPLILWVGGLSGTVMMIGLSRILQCRVITDYIGNHTLSIMGTHQLVIYMMTAFIPMLSDCKIVYGILLLLVIMVFEIPAVWFVDNHLGVFTGRRTKKSNTIGK